MAGDADTTGAICGQLAGAFYGMRAINPYWVEDLRKWDECEIELRAIALYTYGLIATLPPPPSPPSSFSDDFSTPQDASGPQRATAKTFANSNFKKLYVYANPPSDKEDIMAAVQGLVVEFCKSNKVDQKQESNFVQSLRRVALEGEEFDKPCFYAQRLWTCPQTLTVEGKERELSFIINDALRSDEPAKLKHAVLLTRSINQLCVVRGVRDIGRIKFPAGGVLWRGGGLPDQHRPFFTPGCKYRVPGFLATAMTMDITYRFLFRAFDAQAHPESKVSAVRWRVELDQRGEHKLEFRCKNVSYVEQSHFEGCDTEDEYLFAPYTVFTVKAVQWSDTADYDEPHLITLTAAIDNRKEPADLPLAPWY